MTYHARDWLPHGVMSREPVRRGVEAAVSDWARRWFADARIGVSSLLDCPTEARGEVEGGAWRVSRQGVALGFPKWSLQRLVEKALGAPPPGEVATDTDQRLLAEFERRVLDDLPATLAVELSLSEGVVGSARERDPFAGKGGLVVRLNEGNGQDFGALAIPFEILLPFCRASLEPRASPRRTLDGLLPALGSVPLILEATVGRFDLGLFELQELALGDVLMLNKSLGDAFDVTLKGGGQVLGRAVMQSASGSLAFVLHA